MLAPVEVKLVSNGGVHGVVLYSGRKYFIELGWLQHKQDDIYIIDLFWLSKANLVKD